ncbi:MAG: hypothetical protein GQ549_08765 [Gammaproteobacteria bacterium]|nr:hypothetical protein [Gammaproteobacteria bacterium]
MGVQTSLLRRYLVKYLFNTKNLYARHPAIIKKYQQAIEIQRIKINVQQHSCIYSGQKKTRIKIRVKNYHQREDGGNMKKTINRQLR